jgi:adenosylcobinamide kinase/adenosylcobinamide-phosphate guanylyltransferase
MITLVIGGSGSGKSAYAESLLEQFAEKPDGQGKAECRKYYLATMEVCDEESRKKVKRHRQLRAGKGFVTIEQPRDIAGVLERIKPNNSFRTEKPEAADKRQPIAVLIECISNLVANEMFAKFSDGERAAESVASKVLQEMRQLAGNVDELVIVSNNVFEDGIAYDASTMEYLRALAAVNVGLAEFSDRVVEVVVGIPIQIS